MRAGIATAALFLSLIGSAPAFAQARTCTARDDLCRKECVSNFRNSGVCNRTCDARKSDCMSTGCWGNAATSKCGFQKS